MMKYNKLLLLLVILFIGTGTAAAEDLASLLPNLASDDVNTRTNAQLQWQSACLQSGKDAAAIKSVNSQMGEQLLKDIPLAVKVYLLHEMQWTGDADVVPVLVKLLADSEKTIREEAVRALAKNPSAEALNALKKALDGAAGADKKIWEDAIASRGGHNIKLSVESVSPLNLPYVSEEAVAKWMQGYDKLSDLEKAWTLASLTVRKDGKYRQAALDAVKSDNEYLKKNGVLALASLGNSEDIPLMLELLTAYDRNLVTNIMVNFIDDKFDAALLSALKTEKDADRFVAVANILARRNTADAFAVILAAAKAPENPKRVELLGILEQLAKPEFYGDLVDVVLLVTDRGQRDNAERVIVRLSKGDVALVIAKLTADNTVALLPLLGRIGGEAALEIVHKEMKSEAPANRDAAFRALCNWPNAEVAAELLRFAENKQNSEAARIPALRGFARVISLPDDQIGIKISGQDKLTMLKKGMSLALRNEDKQLILERASAVREVDTVKWALEFLGDKDLAQNACRTIVELAHQDYLRKRDKELFTSALNKVLEVCTDNGLKDRARQYLNNMK
ncbi:MAG: HEAT repeat domain-containing protein [Planctomycetaceae bacterium]|jgi:HEAT repeat protein|nr:HEAT repeat domain-containing protein [Planctomycetaceae bacterium]